jgi:hypothetical protein
VTKEHLYAGINITCTPCLSDSTIAPAKPREGSFFVEMLSVISGCQVVELGSWQGSSALSWMKAAHELDRVILLTCVDTWLGSIEHWMDDFPQSEWGREELRIRGGMPRVFDTFCSTITAVEANDFVAAFPSTTRTAADASRRLGRFADLVYIDAAHDFRSVLNDLQDAFHIGGGKSVLAGDDWGWKSVRRGVRFFAAWHRKRITVNPDGDKYVVDFTARSKASRRLQSDFGWRTAF